MISIIIPIYNTYKFLPSLFDSIESQTYKDFEVIFVNDASTDNSLELLKNFESKGTVNVNLINLEVNAGVVNARNIALENAKGEFIAFADSDDILSPFYCEKLFEAIKKDNGYYDFVCSAYVRKFSEFKFAVRKDKSRLKKRVFGISGFADYIRYSVLNLKRHLQPYICMVTPWGKLFKKEIIEKNNIRFKEEFRYSGEDMNFVNDYMKYVSNIVVADFISYFWRRSSGSLSSNNKNYEGLLRSMRSHFEACYKVLDDNKTSDSYNYFLGERFFNNFYLKGYYGVKLKKGKSKIRKELLNLYEDFFKKYYNDYKKTTYKPSRKILTNILYRVFVKKYGVRCEGK